MRKLALLAGLMLAGPALAAPAKTPAEQRYSPAFEQCMSTGDAAQGVNYAMIACMTHEDTQQDKQLNQAYKATMSRLGPAQKTALRESERAWIKNRSAPCDKKLAGEDGQMAQVDAAGCHLDETINRIIFMENYK